MQQLHLFNDSQAMVLCNKAKDALARLDGKAVEGILQDLQRMEPGHRDLPTLQALHGVLQKLSQEGYPDSSVEALGQAVAYFDTTVAATAAKLGKRFAWIFMGNLWRHLAQTAEALPYQLQYSECHAAALYLRASDFPAAEAAAQSIPAWHNCPDALHWYCSAVFWRLRSLGTATPALYRFAWLAPERFASLANELGDRELGESWSHFLEESDELLDARWFPAWCLLNEGAGKSWPEEEDALLAMSDHLADDFPAVAAFCTVVSLRTLEKAEDHSSLLEWRSKLKEINPHFFALYMARKKRRESSPRMVRKKG